MDGRGSSPAPHARSDGTGHRGLVLEEVQDYAIFVLDRNLEAQCPRKHEHRH